MIPDFEYEKKFWADGYEYIAGVDEVGRGAWAGPLVAAAVIFHPDVISNNQLMEELEEIRDSKKLSTKRRRHFSSLLLSYKRHPMSFVHVGIGSVSPAVIDDNGVTAATGQAMREALQGLNQNLPSAFCPQSSIDHTLVDAFTIPGLAKNDHTPIKKGDEKSVTIAAASIIAKEYRDDLMRRHARDPKLSVYGWQTNVGYGTKKHREAISKHGITPHHRRLFVPDELMK